MLHLFYGPGPKQEKINKLLKNNVGEVSKITDLDFSIEKLKSLTSAQGLFNNQLTLVLENVISSKETGLNPYESAIWYDYDTFYNLFYKFTKEGKQKIYLDRINLLKKGKEMIEKTKGKESLFLHYLMTEVDKIYDASGEYFAMIL